MPPEGKLEVSNLTYQPPDGTEQTLCTDGNLVLTEIAEDETEELKEYIRIRQTEEFTFTCEINRKVLERFVYRHLIGILNQFGHKDRKREAAILYSRKARTRKKNKSRYLREARKALRKQKQTS